MNTPKLEANPGTLLTLRQTQVLFYIALGKTLEEIAIILGVARTTAKAHAELLYAKLHVENRSQLITQAFLQGYLRNAAKGATALLLAICCFTSAVQPSADDQLRNFRQARTRTTRSARNGRRNKLHPSLWDFDYA